MTDVEKNMKLLELASEVMNCNDVDIFGRDLADVDDFLDLLRNEEEFPKDVDAYWHSDISLRLDNIASDEEFIEWYDIDKKFYNHLRYTLGFWGPATTPSFEDYKKKYADIETNKRNAARREEAIKEAEKIRNGK